MKLPRWVQVGCRRVKIVRQRPNTEDVGFFGHDGSDYLIAVDPDLSDHETALTLLHEVLHAVSDLGGANLSEKQVLCIEHGLGTAISQNPQLFSQLVLTLTKKK